MWTFLLDLQGKALQEVLQYCNELFIKKKLKNFRPKSNKI